MFNIEIVWGNVEKLGGTKIRDASIDFVLVSNILFQIEQKKDFVREVRRILKRTGKALIVDWSDSFGGMGPLPEFVFSEADAKKLFEDGGMHVERSILAGDHHYGFVAQQGV